MATLQEYHSCVKEFKNISKSTFFYPLEPLCCKKRQKSPCQETGLGNRGRLKDLNDTKLVLDEHTCSISRASNLTGTFLVISYSKAALVLNNEI